MEDSGRDYVRILRKNLQNVLECGACVVYGQAMAQFALIGKLGFLSYQSISCGTLSNTV